MAAAAGACFNAVIDRLCQSLVGSELKLKLSSLEPLSNCFMKCTSTFLLFIIKLHLRYLISSAAFTMATKPLSVIGGGRLVCYFAFFNLPTASLYDAC